MTYKKITLPDNIRNEQALEFTKKIIDTFQKENKLNGLDNMSLYTLCNTFDTYLECEKAVKEHGLVVISDRGNQTTSPYAVLMKQSQSLINVLIKELGLSLGSRSKIKLVQNEVEDSPLAAFIKGN